MANAIDDLIGDLLNTRCSQPFSVLGFHENLHGDGLVLRTWRPDARSVSVVRLDSGASAGEMLPLAPGMFELKFPDIIQPFPYQLIIINQQNHTFCLTDPYQFGELSLIEESMEPHWLHHYLGSRLIIHTLLDGSSISGTVFKVYAPNARSVRVIGSFNGWDGRFHPMASADDGIWRLFIPDVCEGDLYKYEITSQQGKLLSHKADPFAVYSEQAPGNSSIVFNNELYPWQDKNWMFQGAQDRPMSIYEVHLGSWRKKEGRWLSYLELADELIPYVIEMGFTHIECLPVSEHPFSGSWGYQPVGLFAPTSRFGTPDDFKTFVDRCHQNGLGVILDWVPAHFPSDSHGLERFDGTALYEYEDPRKGWHPDWQTYIYDYGKAEVRSFLISNALYWLELFHIDGLRVDAVASMLYLDYSRSEGEWLPNVHGGNEHLEAIGFLKELNETVYAHFPDRMMIAEESTSWPGVSKPTYDNGLGFGFKWNMGWMHDSLEYMKHSTEHRQYHHEQLGFSMVYHYSEHFILPLSHDEVVHGKGTLLTRMPGDEWQKFANLRAYYGFMFAHPGKKLLFMGAELGTTREWNHDDQLEWHLLEDKAFSLGLNSLVRTLNHIYKKYDALWRLDYETDGFRWIIQDDTSQSVFAFYRQGRDSAPILAICNMTPVVRHNYRVGVPLAGGWRELLNTDASEFGGSEVRNQGLLSTTNHAVHEQEFSLVLTLPPLATLYLTYD